MTGRTLGNYRILAPLGAGGMGQVYKAHDARLDRLVAIKVLRPDLAATAATKQRFIQEARSASALNHPNIVTIHDFFRHEDTDCLVMEYIAGKTLTALIPHHGMRVKDALRIAIQIAEGLGKAHSAGIVHRDIKPSNIMIEGEGKGKIDGRVKILDFGLAKLNEPQRLSEEDTTRTEGALTEEGSVIGTAAYMSPEQAQGMPLDFRSDIFSFGSVLYEMLTGARAFRGDSTIGTLAAILRSEPAPPSVQNVPHAVSRIVFRCLEKNPDDRWQSMADVRRLLEDAAKDIDLPGEPAGARSRLLWPVAAGVCLATALVAWGAFRLLSPGPSHSTAAVMLQMVTADSGLTGFPAISRDGKLIAFASDRAGQDNLDIWVQQVGGREPIRLTHDPADESDPAFSPDGTSVAFRSEKDGGGVYVIPSFGGAPVLLAPLGRNPRFSPDGRWIAYSVGGEAVSNPGSAGVFIVSSGGGAPRAIHPEMATATNPVWSPSGDRLLVSGRLNGKAQAISEIDWWTLPIERGAPLRTGAYARMDASKLMRQRFPQGYPAPLDWRQDKAGDRVLFSAFLGSAANLWEIPLLGKGAPERLTLGPGLQGHGAWSGDARSLAFAAEDLNFDIWLQPLDPASGMPRGSEKRLTEQATEELSPSITWDATKVSWISRRSDVWSLHVFDNPTATDRTVLSSPSRLLVSRISGDGAHVLYSGSDYDIQSIPSAGGSGEKLCDRCGEVMGASTDARGVLYEPLDNEDVLLFDVTRRATEKLALRPTPDLILSSSRFSRDGKWIAFHALHNATNSAQIWIAPLGAQPITQSSWIAITDGSKLERDPAWSPDGRFLYYVSERDGFRCLWARPLNPVTKQPTGEPFAVRHFHSARFSLRRVGNQGYLTGLTVGEGALVFAMGELKANVWLEENAK